MEFTPLVLAGFTLASFAGSFVSTMMGIGGGVFLLAVFASVLPPTALIPVHGVVQLGSNLSRTLVMRRSVFLPLLPAFIVGVSIGVALGGVVAVQLPPAFVLIGVGLFILWSLFAGPPAKIKQSGFIIGTLCGTLTMFFGATGPFIAAWIKTFSWGRMTYVGTQAACGVVQHTIKTFMFILLGFSFQQWWLPLLLMIGAGFAGTMAGKVALSHLNDRIFGIALNIVLALLALRLVWQGVSLLLQTEQ